MLSGRAARTAMAKKLPVDRLATEVEKILSDYGNDVQQNLDEIVAQMSKQGAKTLRSQAKQTFKGTGEYAKGWTSQTVTGRFSAQGTIYNKDLPGLPHLLEHGHANRNGGRTPGKAHISTVEDELVRQFEQKVKAAL